MCVTNKFLFTRDKERNRGVWSAFKVSLKVWGTTGKNVEVTISEQKRDKSWNQLKGLYRLMSKILPVLKDIDPSTNFDVEKVKTLIKDQYGYYQVYKGVKFYKSCKDSTIEDMMGLIKTAESFGNEMGVEDCYLSSEEEIALKEFYN